MPGVKKKVSEEQALHREAAAEFEKWLVENYDKPKSVKIKRFNAICDSIALREQLKLEKAA